MAKIRKRPFSLNDPHGSAREARRENDQYLQQWKTLQGAEKINARFRRPDKKSRYDEDMKLLDMASELADPKRPGEAFRGRIRYSPLGNKKLIVGNEGELIRERGYFWKTRKFQRLDPNNNVYIGRFEQKRKGATYEFDADGKLTAKHVRSKDGRFEEKWERDENDELIRTKYHTSRFRDVGFGSAVSEEMSELQERGGKKYRVLTRQKGSTKKVYEREKAANQKRANLNLIERETRSSHYRKTFEDDGKRAKIEVKRFGMFRSTYEQRLDASGKEIGLDTTSKRRLWNKRSNSYNQETGALETSKHTVGKLYKSEAISGPNYQYKERKLFGLRLLPSKLTNLTANDRADNAARADEAELHKKAWKDVIPARTAPPAGSVKQLGATKEAIVAGKSASTISTTKSTDDAKVTAATSAKDTKSNSIKPAATAVPLSPKMKAMLENWKPVTLDGKDNVNQTDKKDAVSAKATSPVTAGSREKSASKDAAKPQTLASNAPSSKIAAALASFKPIKLGEQAGIEDKSASERRGYDRRESSLSVAEW